VTTIAITAGDPCGIGPEVILKALASWRAPAATQLVVIGHLPVFEAAARRLRLRLPSWRLIQPHARWPAEARILLLACPHAPPVQPGRSGVAAGRASLAYLNIAVALCRARKVQALVTGPVTKWAIQRARPRFVGQTELLAAALGRRSVVMAFVSDRLRVALLTRHLPLRRVPQALTRGLVQETLRIVSTDLRRRLGVRRPRLVVCGLNPHAGEAGRFGSEEARVLAPAIRAARRAGILCEGPVAADGFFARPRGDAVICCYHDQGLIPFKMAARDLGCQVTLGLPIVRTAPDHGSALDIARRGVADPGSMRYALEVAARLARRR
jgi:4-hydroxythreonine-4-phosphate dehydrogenase